MGVTCGRTNEDKRRAVMALLNDEEWGKWSDREIARRAGVTHPFVSRLRPPSPSGNRYQMDTRTVQRGDQTFTMDTRNIGQRTPEAMAGDGEAWGAALVEHWQRALQRYARGGGGLGGREGWELRCKPCNADDTPVGTEKYRRDMEPLLQVDRCMEYK